MSNILADTSVWIEFFKSDSPTGDRLENLLKEDAVWTCGVVVFELLQGVKSEKEKSVILDTMLKLEYIEMTPFFWQRAAELSKNIRKKGLTLPLSDIFIAAIAIENNLSVFTLDRHFEKISGVRVYGA